MTTPTLTQLSLLPPAPLKLGDVEEIPLDRFPPQDSLPSEAPTHELVESIRRWGVLEPLLIRAAGGGYRYEDPANFIAGRRRLAVVRRLYDAARAEVDRIAGAHPPDFNLKDDPAYLDAYHELLRWITIPVRVLSDPEGTPYDGRTAALTVTTNAIRQPNPVSDFRAIIVLLTRFMDGGLSERQALTEVSRVTGLPTNTVKQRLRLQALIEPLLQAFISGEMAYSVALEATKLSAEAQERLARMLAQGTKPTLEQVKEARLAQAREAQATLFDALPEMPAAAPATSQPLRERATLLLGQLRAIRLPICQEAATVISELLRAQEA